MCIWENDWCSVSILVTVWLIAEILHHFYYIFQVRRIDTIYAESSLDRDVDVVDHPVREEFDRYWSQCSESHKSTVLQWATEAGIDFFKSIENAFESHISQDFVQSVDPLQSLPVSLFFRTYNSIKIFFAGIGLRKLGFKSFYLDSVHLHYFRSPQFEGERPLLIIYPQFSGEFSVLSIFAKLKDKCDILYVAPRCAQLTWSFRACRHSDVLAEYLPFVLRYKSIVPLCWSAGNLSFQVLDRYLERRGLRDKIKAVIRLDPLGYPTSNFLVYSGGTLSWFQLYKKFLRIGSLLHSNINFMNHFGCVGFAYLLKTSHGYANIKLGRMLRITKLAPAQYPEFLFTASFDPTWALDHYIYESDRKILFSNVSEKSVDGFHGLWINAETLSAKVFPLLLKLLI